MRAYLLGALPEDQASAVEQEYFSNRSFFLQVLSEEMSLIADYLDGHLTETDRRRFEARYLQQPDLRRKVEDVRFQRAAAPETRPGFSWTGWHLALAAGLVFVAGIGGWVYHQRRVSQEPPLVAQSRPVALGEITVNLSPGIVKGKDSRMAQFELPTANTKVRLLLELPGQSSSISGGVALSAIDAEGHWNRVWSSPKSVESTATRGGQQLTLLLDGSLFHRADYMIEITAPERRVREVYVFRVSAPP